MFVPNTYLLNTLVPAKGSTDRARFVFGRVSSRKNNDGLIVKDGRGACKYIKTPSLGRDRHLVLSYCHDVAGVEISEILKIEDEILANRIIDYVINYFAEVRTNCSTFVEYLRTGHFPGCEKEKGCLSFTGGMNLYSGQKIRVGDSICVFYYNHFAKSRLMFKKARNHYRLNRKKKDVYSNMEGMKKSFSASDLVTMYNSGLCRDYHFMYCIGEKDGQPLFISQIGRHEPEIGMSLNVTPIVVSVGMIDVYEHVPIFTLIKRGR